MSTPASVVKALGGSPSDAAALAMRAPSRCSVIPSAWAWSAMARISSGV
jgi:hypothetical protein